MFSVERGAFQCVFGILDAFSGSVIDFSSMGWPGWRDDDIQLGVLVFPTTCEPMSCVTLEIVCI